MHSSRSLRVASPVELSIVPPKSYPSRERHEHLPVHDGWRGSRVFAGSPRHRALGVEHGERQIERRRGKWAVRRVLTVDTSEDRKANLTLKRHWAEVALDRIGTRGIPDGSLYSYNLFAISDEGLAAIREAHLLFFERVRAIVAECRHPTRLALANVQLVPLDVLAE